MARVERLPPPPEPSPCGRRPSPCGERSQASRRDGSTPACTCRRAPAEVARGGHLPPASALRRQHEQPRPARDREDAGRQGERAAWRGRASTSAAWARARAATTTGEERSTTRSPSSRTFARSAPGVPLTPVRALLRLVGRASRRGGATGTSTACSCSRRARASSASAAGHDALAFARPRATTIFLGDRDEFCDVDEGRALAEELGADLRVFEGFDHHFIKSRRAMAEAALPIIAPEVVTQ